VALIDRGAFDGLHQPGHEHGAPRAWSIVALYYHSSRFANIFGASISETTMRPNPRRTPRPRTVSTHLSSARPSCGSAGRLEHTLHVKPFTSTSRSNLLHKSASSFSGTRVYMYILYLLKKLKGSPDRECLRSFQTSKIAVWNFVIIQSAEIFPPL
jgi:hypothetical protein